MQFYTKLLFVFIAAFCFVGCEKESKQADLQLYFTSDVNGRLEPCGCFTGQYGGLTRVDSWLQFNDPANKSLRLDVGDAIKGTTDYDQIHYKYVSEAFARLNYSALNIGAREAALSRDELKKLAREIKVPMISANLIDQATGEPILATHETVILNGQKIAVIGLLDPDSVTNSIGDDLEVNPMIPTLSNLLPEIKEQEKPDVIVLLAFTDEPKMRSLATQFYELNIILGGNVPQPSQEMIKQNESIILYTTNQARAVGDLSVSVNNGSITKSAFDIHLMETKIPQSKEIIELSKNYRDEIRTTKLDVDGPQNSTDDSLIPVVTLGHQYIGSQTCAGCHPSAMKVWQKSSHAHAFKTLEDGETDADPNCIGCHTVGFGEDSGYKRDFGNNRLTNVGCESCHGPGSEHVRQRALGDPSKVTFKFRPLGAAQCKKCHHGEFSRPFEWDEFWPKIAHGKENASD